MQWFNLAGFLFSVKQAKIEIRVFVVTIFSLMELFFTKINPQRRFLHPIQALSHLHKPEVRTGLLTFNM